MEVKMHETAEHGTRSLVPPRRLASDELEVLTALVEHVPEVAERDALRCQVAHALVTEECLRNCGSIMISVEEGACPAADAWTGAPVTGEGMWLGAEVAVLLHVGSGYLRMIEVYRPDGGETRGLPSAGVLEFY